LLQLANRTPFPATFFLSPDPQGIESVYAIIKGTFALGPKMTVADEQAPMAFKDEFTGEPGKSSIGAASDIGLVKPSTDVLVRGAARSPGATPVTQMDVTLSAGPIRKTVRVFGDRVWRAGVLRTTISTPAPFAEVPLVWERAFGGTEQTTGETPELHAEARNPVGVGFTAPRGGKERDGRPLPNLEMPSQLIGSIKDRPPPAGFGPLCPHWEPRRTFAGTYDETWQKERAPYLPLDFDSQFHQLAPMDQQVPSYLKGGEDIEVIGVSRGGPLRFRLPEVKPQATYRLDDAVHAPPCNLDTVLIEPDRSRVVLVWRTVLGCDKKTLRVREIEISLHGNI
jgi:hypothetical protein